MRSGDVFMASPLRPPPSGVASNFDDAGFLALPVIVIASLCLPLVFICAFARVYARVLAKKWTIQDYFFCFNLVVGFAFIVYLIPLTIAKPYGKHVWDIDSRSLTNSWLLRFLALSVFTGPVLWLSKSMVIVHLSHVFKSVRWFKNSGYIFIPVTGLMYALYTCTVSIACAPKPDFDKDSYINGFREKSCSASGGPNISVGIVMALVNALVDFYLLIATFALSPSMNVTVKERRVIYLMHFIGIIASICSVIGLVYRVKTYVDNDLTGHQIPITTALVVEVSISLMIPCMSSFYAIYRHFTYVELNERVTIGASSTRYNSTLSHYKTPSKKPTRDNSHVSTPLPPEQPKKIWRKTHMSVEELPFRKASIDFYRKSPLAFRNSRDSRMKALPPTPLPLASRNNSVADGMHNVPQTPKSPKTPKTPKTPNSIRSMRLPILFERR